jgi:DNA-binding NtrC family response regulator
MGGALVVRDAQWLTDEQIRVLVDAAVADHRLVLLFADADAERRSALDGRSRDLAEALMSRELVLPDLRNRQPLLEPLVEHFLACATIRYRKHVVGLSDEAMRQLSEHSFPGNIAQLQSMVEAAVAHSSGEIVDAEDLDAIR